MVNEILPDWKCARCRCSLRHTAFFPDRAPFNPESDLYCPSCWLQVQKEDVSLIDYKIGRDLSLRDYPFYALIQAAMRGADTDNLEKLKQAFPQVYRELVARYNAPEGRLEGE